MGEEKSYTTFCHICGNHCALKVTVENGKVTDVRGAGETEFPTNVCSVKKGESHIIGTLNNSDRLKHPLKRRGERGEGEWEKISWDEALDTIASEFQQIREEYGPERLAMVLGEPKGMEFAFAQRFATAFGTPNTITPGNYCGVMTTEALRYTFGMQAWEARTENDPEIIVIWGTNLPHTGGSFIDIQRNYFNSAVEGGTKIVVIDPRNIEVWPEKGMHASDADYWLRPRPNSDGVLAMGIIKVIVEEELYDKEYVESWTKGFDELQKEVKTFTLREVENLTWVPEEKIREVAKLYAENKPGIIGSGNSLEFNSQSFQACRALAILQGITGNVNTPDGGLVELKRPNYYPPGRFMLGDLKDRLAKYPRSPKRTIGGKFSIANKGGFVPTQSLTKALLEGKPYQPKAAFALVTNPLITYPDSKATKKAFKKLDFFVISELFHTATTEIADIVLPAAPIHEHETIAFWPAWFGMLRAQPKLVDPPGEAWPDIKIINELAKRLGFEEYFWDDESEALDYMLRPMGLSWEEFRDNVKHVKGERRYDPNEVSGYRTNSGRVEIHSESLKDMGGDPIPKFEKLKEPLMGSFKTTKEYPLVVTNYKSEIFMLSGYRNVEELREKSPPPTVIMNAETAEERDLENGDWIYIETENNKVKQKLFTDPKVHPKIVITEFGWGNEEFTDSNTNLITDYDTPCDPLTGTPTIRGNPCKVYKA